MNFTPTQGDWRIITQGLEAYTRELARKAKRLKSDDERRVMETFIREVHALRRQAEWNAS